MSTNVLKQLRGTGEGFTFNRNVTYWLPYDLSITFGTIMDNMRKWIKNDLHGVVNFNHEFVDTQLISDKSFFWTSGILAQARKPVLNLQFNVDHLYEHPAYMGNTFRNKEGMNYIDEKMFHYRVLAFEDDRDMRNNLEIRFAFKNIHMDVHAGVVDISRPKANNIAHFWHTQRNPNNQVFKFDQIIDFKIPVEIMNLIAERFHLKANNHHDVLKFLNTNSFVPVYYGMSGYDGKMYYFLRYPCKSLITSTGMTNPEPWAEEGQLVPEVYTVERDFTLDVMVPMYMSFTTYGDRIQLEDPKYQITDKWEDIDMNSAAGNLNERFIEVERVFKDKHLITEVRFSWKEEDLITHPSGTVTTKKISLVPFLDLEDDDDEQNIYMKKFMQWAKKKGYSYIDIFNFQLYQNPGIGLKNIEKRNDPLRKVIEVDDPNMTTATIPKDNDEYEYYLKNMEEFCIVDFKPDLNRELYGQLYASLAIINEYEYETNNANEVSYGNDDLGFDTGYGHSKVNQSQNKY